MELRRQDAMDEREAWTQGAFVAALRTRPRTTFRAIQCELGGRDFILKRVAGERLSVIRRTWVVGPACLLAVLIVFVLVLAGCSSGGGNRPPADTSVAKVGTVTVTQDELNKLEDWYIAAGNAPDKKKQPKEWKQFEQGVADYLVVREILKQQAATFSVTVTDEEVAKKIDQIKQMFLGDQAKFDDALKKQNLTLPQLKEALADQLLFDRMKTAVTGDLQVTDAEVKAYYDAHADQFTVPETREARHILIKPAPAAGAEPTEADWEAAKANADKVRAEIMNGTDFVVEARKYSDDAVTKEKGGDLGTISRGQMTPDFEQAVFSLNKNELSQPVKTQYGYSVIQVTDINPQQQKTFDEVKETLHTQLLTDRQNQAWNDWIKKKKTDLNVVYREGLAPQGTSSTSG
jgi:foldase protein PrsA